MFLNIVQGNIINLKRVGGKRVMAKCVTTNAIVKSDGKAVMGAGVAKAFKLSYEGIDKDLGDSLNTVGNNVAILRNHEGIDLVSFPTKVYWHEKSIMDLIARSAKQLAVLAEEKYKDGIVLLPIPGCTNGGLDWDDVSKVIAPILPENVVLIYL